MTASREHHQFSKGLMLIMSLVDKILSEENIKESIKAVMSNKGAPGIDGMTVKGLMEYFDKYGEDIKSQIQNKQYKPQPVRRVYIPKPNSEKMRPLGIPTVVDRVVQEMVSRVLMEEYEPYFSDHVTVQTAGTAQSKSHFSAILQDLRAPKCAFSAFCVHLRNSSDPV